MNYNELVKQIEEILAHRSQQDPSLPWYAFPPDELQDQIDPRSPPQPPPAPKKECACVIVENMVEYKKFYYCRTHDSEADHILYCRKAYK